MTRLAIFHRAVGLCAVGALLAGCMALPRVETAVLQDPLLTRKGTLPLKAGMLTLKDARPAQEREGDLEYFTERVTQVILTDLSEARLFTAIEHVTDRQVADVILRGEIRSFRWKPAHRWVPYVPALGILAAFGVPVAASAMDVEIALELVDPRTAQAIASYTKAAHESQSYFVYRYQDSRAGDDRERDSALRRVAVDLQTAILEDRERIVAALK